MPEQTIIPSGIYRTTGGSTLDLRISAEGGVTGLYSTIHGQPKPGEQFPLTGSADGDLIGFVVAWRGYHSLTSWCGRYGFDGERPCIRTVWHLARAYADPAHTIPTDHWESFLTYTGTYYKEL